MSALFAIAVNLTLAGVPVMLITLALLALFRGAPARLRYLLALGGFAAAVIVPMAMTAEAPAQVVTAVDPAPASGFDYAAGALMLWLAGGFVLVARDVVLMARANQKRAAGSRLSTMRFDDVASPRTEGLLRPVVVLPRSLEERDEVVAAIIRHEEAHARWRDPLVHALVRIVRGSFWISPALWLGERLIAREREAAADDHALRTADAATRADYAAALVQFGRVASHDAFAVSFGAASNLEYRVRRILRFPRGGVIPAAASLVTVVAAGAALALVPLAERPGPTIVRPPEQAVHGTPAAPEPVMHLQRARSSASTGKPAIAPLPLETVNAFAAVAGNAPGVRLRDRKPEIIAEEIRAAAIQAVDEDAVRTHRDADADGHVDVHVDVHRDGDGKARDDQVITIRNVIRRQGRDDTLRPEREGRSRHPVALFHRAVTAPIKRAIRAARDAPPQ
jgi:beta-lactamase regulating signal transducer with metallopeptidase domain